MKEKFSLKDHLFNQKKVKYLASLLTNADSKFAKEVFVDEVMSRFPELELKDRIRHITDVLTRHLPADYKKAVEVVIKSLPSPLDPTKSDNDFGDFIFAPYGEYVAKYGCEEKYLSISYKALEELTQRFSMEDAIRYFLRAFPKETLLQCRVWSRHDSYHVRRLVSEGTRPLLPWSGRVPLTSADTLPLLDTLHSDSTRYVTRSVANHLNDIGKREPNVVIDVLKKWQKAGQQDEKELAWMTRHALRTLIKQGNKDALHLLGYGEEGMVTVNQFGLDFYPNQADQSHTLIIDVSIATKNTGNILIDYSIHFVKKNGQTSPKVFKWKTLATTEGQIIELQKRHTLRGDATTYKLYSGEHRVVLKINGEELAEATFIIH
ncbi:MAG: hypothetical protein ACK42D_00310 [Candidatus Paceibacteria bacterium]